MSGGTDRLHRIVAALSVVPLFQVLPAAELEALAHQVTQRRAARNEVVFAQGDGGDGLYLVAVGHVGISRQNAEGDELLLALCEPGDYFGDLALLDGAPRSATAVAFEDSVLLFLPRGAFVAVLDAHPAALWRCLAVVVAHLRRLTEVADDIALIDVRHRLAHRLLMLAEQGLVTIEGERSHHARQPPRITQQHLANMTGATRESVNKQLQSFAAEGLIILEQGRVHVVDSAGLARIGEGR